MNSDYKIIRLSDEKFTDLKLIYKSAFGTDPNLDELKRKFNTSSFVEKNVGYIAYSNANEPAAFYGVFPCFMHINGKKTLVCQSGDTMTHANHRRKGLFVKLAQKTYDLCDELGIELVFGFPNENSYPGFVKKLAWKHENNIYCYRIKCQSKFLLLFKKIYINSISSKKQLEVLTTNFRNYNSLIDETNNNLIPRDVLMHNYKQYFEKYLIEIRGKLIYLKPSKEYLYVGDIENCSFQEFKKIVNELKKISNKLNIPFLRFNLSSGSKFEIFVKKIAEKMSVNYPIGYTNFTKERSLKNVNFSHLDYDTF